MRLDAHKVSTFVFAAVAVVLLFELARMVARVAALEGRELDVRGAPVALASLAVARDHSLVEADLERGERAVFELCSSDAMGDAWGRSVDVEVRVGDEVALRTELNDSVRSRARVGANGACLEVGHGTLELSGTHRIVVRVSETPPDTSVRGRILAQTPLEAADRNRVLTLLGLTSLGVLVLAVRPSRFGLSHPRRSRALRAWRRVRVLLRRKTRVHPWTWGLAVVLAASGIVTAFGMISPLVLPGGPTYGLLAGLGLAGVEMALAGAFGALSSARLALTRPSSLPLTIASFALAPFVGLALQVFAVWSLSRVPPSGEAPIEAFVSWPSGMLSFGTLAVVAPVAEEAFFRGLVFGAIDDGRWGARRAVALSLATGLFSLAHAQQAWGNWGGLLAVSVAGFVFTLLRAVSGSTLVPAMAHLAYNALLSISALTAAGALVVSVP